MLTPSNNRDGLDGENVSNIVVSTPGPSRPRHHLTSNLESIAKEGDKPMSLIELSWTPTKYRGGLKYENAPTRNQGLP